MIGRNGVWSAEQYIEKVWRDIVKHFLEIVIAAMLPYAVYAYAYGNVGSVVVVSDKDFQFVKDDIKWVKYSLVFVTILMFKK